MKKATQSGVNVIRWFYHYRYVVRFKYISILDTRLLIWQQKEFWAQASERLNCPFK